MIVLRQIATIMKESDRTNFISSFQTITPELCWLIVDVCYRVTCNLSNSSFAALPIQKQFKKDLILLLPALSDVSTCLGISGYFKTSVFSGKEKIFNRFLT